MSPSLLGGLTKSLAMTVLSEVGDKTFFAAAILAMHHPRKLVLAGCLSALTVMTALSASLGWVAPNLISRKWTHHITTLLFFVFGIWSLWEGFKEEGESEDLAELEAKLDVDFKSNKGESKNKSKEFRPMKTKAASLPPGVTAERCWCGRLAKVKQVEDFSDRFDMKFFMCANYDHDLPSSSASSSTRPPSPPPLYKWFHWIDKKQSEWARKKVEEKHRRAWIRFFEERWEKVCVNEKAERERQI